MHQTALPALAAPPRLRHPPLRWQRRQNPLHQTAPPKCAALSRPPRPPRTATRHNSRQRPLHQNVPPKGAAPSRPRRPPRMAVRRNSKQKPVHQNVPPTGAAISRPRRPPRMATRCNSRQKPMRQNAARRLPTRCRPRDPTARRAGGGRACNDACTGAKPRAPSHDMRCRGKISVAGPRAAAPRRRATGGGRSWLAGRPWQSGEAVGAAVFAVIASAAAQSRARCAPGWGLLRRFAPRNDRGTGVVRRSAVSPIALGVRRFQVRHRGVLVIRTKSASDHRTGRQFSWKGLP